MRRRLWIMPLAGALLLAGAQAAFWRYEAGQLDAGFAAFLAQLRAGGWTARAGPATYGGWPLSATASIPDVVVEGGTADIPGGLAWHSTRLELRVDMLSPGTLQLRAEGPQRLRLGALPVFAGTAASMVALLPLQQDQPPRQVSFTAHDLRLGTPGAPPSAMLTVGLVQFDGAITPDATSGQPALSYRLSTEAINLPEDRRWALGSRLSSLSVEGAVTGPMPLQTSLAARAAAWRDGGGTLTVEHMAMGWGPLGASGGATLALDARLQPMGTGHMRLIGFAESLDALASDHVMTPGAAIAAKAVLSLLATTPEGGGPPEVEVPLTLQDRTLSMRQVPLLKLPEVIWPTE